MVYTCQSETLASHCFVNACKALLIRVVAQKEHLWFKGSTTFPKIFFNCKLQAFIC